MQQLHHFLLQIIWYHTNASLLLYSIDTTMRNNVFLPATALGVATIISASTSTSSTPGRQLDGKSGKASFPATPEDYAWLVGEYDPTDLNLPIDYNYNQVLLDEGEPVLVHPAGLGMYYAAKLDIKPLRAYPSLVFQATLDIKFTESDLEFREVMEGVGSFNPGKVDEITFHSDHKESRNSPDEEWVPGLLTEYAELTTLECSKVPISTRGNYRL